MERRTRQTLVTILGWVGYGLSYSEDHDVAVADGRVKNGPRTDTAEVKAVPKRVEELGNWQSRPQATEVITDAADGRGQLAGPQEPAERVREATATRLNEAVQKIADLGRQWADPRQGIEQPGNGSDPELRARPEKPGRTASSQPETPSASTIERGGGPVSTVGRPLSSQNPSAGFDGDGANAPSFFRWPSLLAFPKVLATHMPRFLTRMGRQNPEDLSESIRRPPEREESVAVARLRRMLEADATVAVERSRES